jgi:hypothetical protein
MKKTTVNIRILDAIEDTEVNIVIGNGPKVLVFPMPSAKEEEKEDTSEDGKGEDTQAPNGAGKQG